MKKPPFSTSERCRWDGVPGAAVAVNGINGIAMGIVLPVLAASAIAVLVASQARQLAESEIRSLETQLLEAKKAELRNYVTQARNAFYFIYGPAAPDVEALPTSS